MQRDATRETLADAILRGQLYGLLAGELLLTVAATGILGS
jgi:hypothetical protein